MERVWIEFELRDVAVMRKRANTRKQQTEPEVGGVRDGAAMAQLLSLSLRGSELNGCDWQ